MNNQLKHLNVYLDFAELSTDNNLVENAIRPFVVGRKNWLFSRSLRSADAGSLLYSLIETANANGFEPYWYLYYLFEHFPYVKSDDEKRALLPYMIDRSDFDAFKLARYCL